MKIKVSDLADKVQENGTKRKVCEVCGSLRQVIQILDPKLGAMYLCQGCRNKNGLFISRTARAAERIFKKRKDTARKLLQMPGIQIPRPPSPRKKKK